MWQGIALFVHDLVVLFAQVPVKQFENGEQGVGEVV